MEKIDYNQLYRLQDRVLTAVPVQIAFYSVRLTVCNKLYFQVATKSISVFFQSGDRRRVLATA